MPNWNLCTKVSATIVEETASINHFEFIEKHKDLLKVNA